MVLVKMFGKGSFVPSLIHSSQGQQEEDFEKFSLKAQNFPFSQ
jgi:hypothetical protein